MEINKLNFDLFKSGITNSFEELDINADGKINEADKEIAPSSEIKNIITQLLSSTDDESELELDNNYDSEETPPKTGNWLDNPSADDIKKALKLPETYKVELQSPENPYAFKVLNEAGSLIGYPLLQKNDDGSYTLIYGSEDIKYTKNAVRMFTNTDLVTALLNVGPEMKICRIANSYIQYDGDNDLYKFTITTEYGEIKGEIVYNECGSQIFIKENCFQKTAKPGVDGAIGLLNFDKNGNRITEKPDKVEILTGDDIAHLLGLQASGIKFKITAKDDEGRITEFIIDNEHSSICNNTFKGTIVYKSDGSFEITNMADDLNPLNIPQNVKYDTNGYKILSEKEILNKLGDFGAFYSNYMTYGNIGNLMNVTSRDEFGKITSFELSEIGNYNRKIKFKIEYIGNYISISPLSSPNNGYNNYLFSHHHNLTGVLMNNNGDMVPNEKKEFYKLAYGEKDAQEYTGSKGGKYYQKGTLADGIVDDLLYIKGVVAENQSYFGRRYVNGKLAYGLVNGKYYDFGVPINGKFKGILYKNGLKYTGHKLENGVLLKYVDGVVVKRLSV